MIINKDKYNADLKEFMDAYAVNFGVNNVDRLVIINLLCSLTQSIRKTAPKTAVTDVINKIITDDSTASDDFMYRVSLWCESLLEGDQISFPDFGFTDTKSKVQEIKRIYNNILPF